MTMTLSVEEKSIIRLYAQTTPQREEVLHELEENLPAVEDQEIHDTMSGLISILSAMSDEQFQEIDFSDAIDAFEDVSDLDVGASKDG